MMSRNLLDIVNDALNGVVPKEKVELPKQKFPPRIPFRYVLVHHHDGIYNIYQKGNKFDCDGERRVNQFPLTEHTGRKELERLIEHQKFMGVTTWGKQVGEEELIDLPRSVPEPEPLPDLLYERPLQNFFKIYCKVLKYQYHRVEEQRLDMNLFCKAIAKEVKRTYGGIFVREFAEVISDIRKAYPYRLDLKLIAKEVLGTDELPESGPLVIPHKRKQVKI